VYDDSEVVLMLADRREFDFLFYWLDVVALLHRDHYAMHDREGIRAVIDLAEQIADREFATHLRASDLSEPKLHLDGKVTLLPQVARAVGVMADAGLFSTVFDTDHGGLQLPHVAHMAALGILMSGNLATASFALLTVANARLLTSYASPPQLAAFALPQIAGTTMGTMCMSEPHAGSSLGDIRTRAVADGADQLGTRYRITGNKMWISGGDHDATTNIVHLVLAKVPSEQSETPAGTRDISLFIVPKILPDGQANDVTVAGLNHKMGYRGIPNCALNFGEGKHRPDGGAGAIGWLVGDAGQGLPQMFHMMNEARISVGLAAAMLACRGYQMSLDYARQRRQGRPPGVTDGPQLPIIEHADVRRMLLAQKALSQGALALVLFSARLLDDEKTAATEAERRQAGTLLGLLTPITKAWPSEWMQLSLHHALQIHGGSGYTRDFEVEQLYRDNRLNPIHEGTTGIQGIDLVGRKIRRDKGAAFGLIVDRIRGSIDRAGASEVLTESASELSAALCEVEQAVAALIAEPNDRTALAQGTPFLFAFGHLVVGWLWLDQALAAEDMLTNGSTMFSRPFLEGRIRACRYFAETELPSVAIWAKPVRTGSTLVLDAPIDEF
jgi:alkylation response protein AidB-like acyl-CoA dehydrogenase